MLPIMRRFNRKWYAQNKKIRAELSELRAQVPRVSSPRLSWRNFEGYLAWPLICYARLIGWLACDLHESFWRHEREFDMFGVHVFAAPQGAGKTMSLVEHMRMVRAVYPRAHTVANFECVYATHKMESWEDFFKHRNGKNGVVFYIDEIQNEWANQNWKEFPPELLAELTQQRKQRIAIYASSQQFLRIVKPIRDQSFTVIEVAIYFKRLVIQKAFDAFAYEQFYGQTNKEGKKRHTPLWSKSYIANHHIRGQYDTYQKIKKMGKSGITPPPWSNRQTS